MATNVREELDAFYSLIQADYDEAINNYGRINAFLNSSFSVNSKTVDIKADYEAAINQISGEIDAINMLSGKVGTLRTDYIEINDDNSVTTQIDNLKQEKNSLNKLLDTYEEQLDMLKKAKNTLDKKPQEEGGGGGAGSGSKQEEDTPYTDYTKDMATAGNTKGKIACGEKTVQDILGKYSLNGIGLLNGTYLASGVNTSGDINLPPIEDTFMGISVLEELIANTTSQINANISDISSLNDKITAAQAVPATRLAGVYCDKYGRHEYYEPNEPAYSGAQRTIAVCKAEIARLENEINELKTKQTDNNAVLDLMKKVYQAQCVTENNNGRWDATKGLSSGINGFKKSSNYNGQGPCWVNEKTGETLTDEAYASRVSTLDFFMGDVNYDKSLNVNESDFRQWQEGVHSTAVYLQFQTVGALNLKMGQGMGDYDTTLVDGWYKDFETNNSNSGKFDVVNPGNTDYWEAMLHGEFTSFKANTWGEFDGDLGEYLEGRIGFQESYENWLLDGNNISDAMAYNPDNTDLTEHEYYAQFAQLAVSETDNIRSSLFNYDAGILRDFDYEGYTGLDSEKQAKFNDDGYNVVGKMYTLWNNANNSYDRLNSQYGDVFGISENAWNGMAKWRSSIDSSGLYSYEDQFLNQYGEYAKNNNTNIKVASHRDDRTFTFDGEGNVRWRSGTSDDNKHGLYETKTLNEFMIDLANDESNDANISFADLINYQDIVAKSYDARREYLTTMLTDETLDESKRAKYSEELSGLTDKLNVFNQRADRAMMMLAYFMNNYHERAEALAMSEASLQRENIYEDTLAKERQKVDEKYSEISPENRGLIYLIEYFITSKKRAKNALEEDDKYLTYGEELDKLSYDSAQASFEKHKGDLIKQQTDIEQKIKNEELAKAREKHSNELNPLTATTGSMIAFEKKIDEEAEVATRERLEKLAKGDTLAMEYKGITDSIMALGDSDKERYNDVRTDWQKVYDEVYLEEVKKAREKYRGSTPLATATTGAMVAFDRIIEEEALAATEARMKEEGHPLWEAFQAYQDVENEIATARTTDIISYTDRNGNVITLTDMDGNPLTYAANLENYAKKSPLWDTYSSELLGIGDVNIAYNEQKSVETNSGAEVVDYQQTLLFTDKDGNKLDHVSAEAAALFIYQKAQKGEFDMPNLWKFGNNSDEWNEIFDIYSNLCEEHIDASKIPTMMFFANLFAEDKDDNGNLIGFNYLDNNFLTSSTDKLLDNARMFQGLDLAYDRINIYRDLENDVLGASLYALTDGIFTDGLQQFGEGMQNFLGYTSTRTTAREYKNQHLNNFFANEYGKYYQTVYELGSVTGNMLPSIAMSYACSSLIATQLFGMTMSQVMNAEGIAGALMQAVCQSPGSVLMYMSSAGNYKLEGLRDGLTLEEAKRYGAISGLSEVLLERFLGGIPGVSNVERIVSASDSKLIQLGLRMFSEGNEEFWQDILAPYFKAASRDGEGFFTNADGKRMSIGDVAQEIDLEGALHSFSMGALSGGLMGGNVVSSSVNNITKAVYGVDFTTLFQQHLSSELANVENAKYTHPLRNPSAYINALDATMNDFQKIKNNLDTRITEIQEQLAADDGIQQTFNDYNEGRKSSKVNFDSYLREVSTLTALNTKAEIKQSAVTDVTNSENDTISQIDNTSNEQIEIDKTIEVANELAKQNYQPLEPEEHTSLVTKIKNFFENQTNKGKVDNTVDAYVEVKNRINHYEEVSQHANNVTIQEGARIELERLHQQEAAIQERFNENGIIRTRVENLINTREQYEGQINKRENEITEISNKIGRLNPNRDTVEIDKLKTERSIKYTELTGLYEKLNVTDMQLDSEVNNKVDVRDIAGDLYIKNNTNTTNEVKTNDNTRVGKYETLLKNIHNLMNSMRTSNGLNASVIDVMRTKLDSLIEDANRVRVDLVNTGVDVNQELNQSNMYQYVRQLSGLTTTSGNALVLTNIQTEDTNLSVHNANEENNEMISETEEEKITANDKTNYIYGSIGNGSINYSLDITNNTITIEGRTYTFEELVNDSVRAISSGINTINGLSTQNVLELVAKLTKNNNILLTVSRDTQGLLDTLRNLNDGEMLFNYQGVLHGDKAIIIPSDIVKTYTRDMVIRIVDDISGISANPVNSRTVGNFLLELAKYDKSAINYVNKDSLIEMLIDDGKLSVNEVLDGLNKENRKSLVDDIYHKNSNFFVNEILPNLTKQEVGLYLNVDNIGYLSNDNIIKVRESYSDIVDSILGNVDSLITEVARDTNNPLFGKLLNPEGNMAFFGNLTRNDVISKISDYIIRNHDILRNTMNTNNYLEVPELRRLILNNNTMLEIIGNNNNRQMIDKLDDAEIYSRMRQLSSISDITLYNQYMSAVLSASKTVNRLNAIDVINYYMRNATFSDITEIEQVKKALVISDIVEGILGDNLLSITDGTIHFKADTLDMVTANNMLSYIDCLEKLTSNGVDILGLMNKEQVELFSKVIPCVKNELARVTNNTNGNITVNQHAVANVMTSTDINARSVREDLISKVKDKYIGITRRQAEAFLMTMEAIPGNDGICNYADVASAIFERYINDIDGQVKFEKTFGFKMYKDGHLNEAELLTDMYLRVTGDEIISRESDGTYTVANNNIGYIHLTDVIESNTTYRLDQIQKYLNEKGIYVDSETLKQHRIIDTINNKVNSSEIDTIKNNIIEEVTEALNKGNHVSISSNPGLYMRNIATNSPAHVSETHIMTVYGIDSQGRLLVEANVNNRVNKYSVDIGSALSDGVGITIDTLSMDLSKQLSMSEILGNVTNINDYRQTEGKLAAGMVERGGNNAVNELLPRPIDRRRVQIDLGNKTYTCNLYGRLYQYGEERIGVNQHTIALNVEKGGMNLQILRDQVRAKYPRMKVSEIDKFLWSMEGADGSLGICNYADVANAIFNYYTQIPDGANTFQQQFGFPMFGTDGRVNGRQLLVDMMLDISGDKLITKKGLFKGFTAEENNRGYRNLAKPIYDNMTEQYDIKLIKDYVSKRGINPDNVNEIFLFDSNDKVKMYGDYRLQADTVLVEVYNSLVQGKHVSLVGTSNLVLYDIANQNYTKLAGAHIMSIYGIDANGNLLVDSWGRRFAINIDMALQSNSRIRLAVLSMEQPRIQNQNLGNISVNDYNQIIEHAIRVMNAKNAQDSRYYSGYAALERYILEGKIEHFTSTDNVRQLIQNVPREYVRKYMEQVRQIQQQYNQILKYALDTMNQKYGDGFTRLEAYVNGQGPNVLTSTGDVRRLVTQVPVDYIRGYLNAISNSYNNNYGMQRGSMEAVIEDGNIVTSRENDYDINVSVDADGEYLTEEDIKEKSGWNMFLDSLFNTPNKEQFTTIADQKIFSHNELPKSITNSKIYTKYQSLEETNYYDDNGNQISTIKNLRDLSDSEIIDLINLIKKYNEYQDMYYTELDIAKHMELSEMFDAVNNEILQGRKIPTRKYQQYILAFSEYYARINALDIKFDFKSESFIGKGIVASHSGIIRSIIDYNTKSFHSDDFVKNMDTIFHEVQHEIQDQELKMIRKGKISANKYSLTNSIDTLLREEYGLKYYNSNYHTIFNEIDARYNAALITTNYIQKINPEFYEAHKDLYMADISYEEHLYDNNVNLLKVKEKMLTRAELLERVLAKKPKVLDKHPALKYVFNEDGSNKTLRELYDVIESNNKYEVTEMINYWIRTRESSLETYLYDLFEGNLSSKDGLSDYAMVLENMHNATRRTVSAYYEGNIPFIEFINNLKTQIRSFDTNRSNDVAEILDAKNKLIDEVVKAVWSDAYVQQDLGMILSSNNYELFTDLVDMAGVEDVEWCFQNGEYYNKFTDEQIERYNDFKQRLISNTENIREVDTDGEYLTEEDVRAKSGWSTFLDSLFGTPSKENFTSAANQKTILDEIPDNPSELADVMINSEYEGAHLATNTNKSKVAKNIPSKEQVEILIEGLVESDDMMFFAGNVENVKDFLKQIPNKFLNDFFESLSNEQLKTILKYSPHEAITNYLTEVLKQDRNRVNTTVVNSVLESLTGEQANYFLDSLSKEQIRDVVSFMSAEKVADYISDIMNINSTHGNVNHYVLTELIDSIPIESINSVLSNMTVRNRIQVLDYMSTSKIGDYFIETLQDTNTRKNIGHIGIGEDIQNYFISDNVLERIKEKVKDDNYCKLLGELCTSENFDLKVYSRLYEIKKLAPYLREDRSNFYHLFEYLTNIDEYTSFIDDLSSLSESELKEIITFKSFTNLSEEKLQILKDKLPGIYEYAIDSIKAQDIIYNTMAISKFNDYGNNSLLFGNKPKDYYIKMEVDYLLDKRNSYLLDKNPHVFFIDADLVHELLTRQSFVDTLNTNKWTLDFYNNFIISNQEVYDIIDKNTTNFRAYAADVIEGKSEFKRDRLDDVLGAYRLVCGNGSDHTISPEIAKAVYEKYAGHKYRVFRRNDFNKFALYLEKMGFPSEEVVNFMLAQTINVDIISEKDNIEDYAYEYLLASSNIEPMKAARIIQKYLDSQIEKRGMTTITTIDGITYNRINGMDAFIQPTTVKYIRAVLDKLPVDVKASIKEINLYDMSNPGNKVSQNKYTEGFDGYFRSVATTFSSSGEICFWGLERLPDANAIYHESGHCYDKSHQFSGSDLYQEAMKNDKAKTGKESVTDYGKNSPPEDFAEAFAKYFEGKLDKFPNRKAYFDNLFKDEIASSRKKHKYFNKPVKERSGINGVSEDIYLDKQFSILGMIRGSRNNTNIEGIQIRDITSNYVTDARYESTTGDKLSLLDIVEILNNKVDVVPNMRSSFANNELMNGSVRLGISMDTIIDDIANAKLQGINIMVSNDIERLINVKNNLRSGEVLLNTYDVYRGGKAFIRQSNGDIFVGNRVLNIENTFDNFIQGKDKITTKKLADICDSLKAYELLNGNGIQVSEDSIRSMYDYMNNYFLLKDAVDAESMLNFVYAFTKYSARLNGVNVEVEFYNGEKGEFGGQARGIIALNGNFSGARNTIPYIRTLNTIFHEVYHEIQDNDTGSTRYTLGNRIDNLLKKNNALYYEDNYNMIFFEIDARYHAALMTLEYLESVAPEAYNMYKDEYMLQVVSEEANYEKNDNKYESDGITLSRDEALESIIKNNPKLLNSNEVLRFIFNDDGTRKTLFELTDVIKQNNNNQDITEMINYWVRTSSYSLESITREFFEIYKHGTVGLPNEFIQVVNNSLRHKLSETISLEIKNKVDITTKMNDILKNYQINSLKDGVVIDSFLKDMNTLVSDINNNLANTSTNSIKNMFNRNERNGAIKEELPSKTLDTAIEDISREIVRLDDRQKNRREILNNKLRVYKESKIASERLLKSYDLTSDVETKYASLEQEKLIKEEALKIYEKATRLAEAVTRDMHMLELVDGYLVGEENSIKEFDSIARKINEKALKNQGDDVLDTIRKIASEIGDGLRYTMILDIDSYVDDFSECISTLKYMGYSVKSINNAWIDDKNTTYNGINVKLDKQIGEEVITLEVQFHTEESYLTKENYTHDIYKIERGLFANEIDIKTAHDIQVSLQEIVEKPKHIGRIGNEEKIIKKNC